MEGPLVSFTTRQEVLLGCHGNAQGARFDTESEGRVDTVKVLETVAHDATSREEKCARRTRRPADQRTNATRCANIFSTRLFLSEKCTSFAKPIFPTTMADQENKKKARRRLSRVKVSAGIGEKLDALADQIEVGGNDGGKNSDSMSKGRRMSTRVLQAHKIYEGDKVERTRGSKTRLARLSSEAKMKEPNEASTTPKDADTNVAPQTSEP
eukprot:115339-Amorphochlora_amoeboformis.AAC.1